MSIQGFDVKDQSLAQADTISYSFDFKIFKASDLLIYLQDVNGVILFSFTGDNSTYVAGLTFDSINGGGTLTLAGGVLDDQQITFMLAPDLPDQPSSFPNKGSFNLDAIEGAFDYLCTQIQRVAWLAQRSARMHDLDDTTSFNPTMPLGMSNHPGGILSVKPDGTGFEIIVTAPQVQQVNGGYYVRPGNSRSSPLFITSSGGITISGVQRETIFVAGSIIGLTTISKNPQISPGTIIGQELLLFGCVGSQALRIASVNGVELGAGGNMDLVAGSAISMIWDGDTWTELFRK